MLLYKAYIENFRNISNININFSEFNVIIGENNIGKTNILTAIHKVLSKNIYFNEDDFKILEKPIVIELSFNQISYDEEMAIFFDFDGVYNPENEDITIKTIVNWRSTIGNVDISVNFIRKDLPESEQEVKIVNRNFRKTLSSIYISAHRNYNKNMDSKGIFELLRLFAPYQTMSLDSLKQEIFEDFQQLNMMGCELNLDIVQDSLNNNRQLSDDILNDLSKINQESHFSVICDKIVKCSEIYNQKIMVNDDLLKLNENHKEYYNFIEIETEMNKFFSPFLNDDDLKFDIMPTEDIDLLKNISMDISGDSILRQGDGYQNFLDLLINLSNLIKIKNSNEVDRCNFIVMIEEPETHLHPHMQRNLIKSLKEFKDLFQKRNIYIQFFISTHSPHVVSNLNIPELNIIRKSQNNIVSVKLEENYIQNICSEFFSETKCSSKSLKNINNVINGLLSFSDVFFSKEVILCEGYSDFGALPILANKLECNLDQYGISLLNLKGVGNLKLHIYILKKFKIPTYCIIDADKKEEYGNLPNISFLGEDPRKDGAFELEFYNNAPHYRIFNALDSNSPSRSRDRIQKIKNLICDFDGFDSLDETSEELLDNYKEDSRYRKLILDFMNKEKGTQFGRILAEELDVGEIPHIFKEAFENAINLIEENYAQY